MKARVWEAVVVSALTLCDEVAAWVQWNEEQLVFGDGGGFNVPNVFLFQGEDVPGLPPFSIEQCFVLRSDNENCSSAFGSFNRSVCPLKWPALSYGVADISEFWGYSVEIPVDRCKASSCIKRKWVNPNIDIASWSLPKILENNVNVQYAKIAMPIQDGCRFNTFEQKPRPVLNDHGLAILLVGFDSGSGHFVGNLSGLDGFASQAAAFAKGKVDQPGADGDDHK